MTLCICHADWADFLVDVFTEVASGGIRIAAPRQRPGRCPNAPDARRAYLPPTSMGQCVGKRRIESFVSRKSATRIAIEVATTVRVVDCPTPSVPPRVTMP